MNAPSRRRVQPSVSGEADLFGAPSVLPEGFCYRPGLLSADEEAALAREVAALPFKPFDWLSGEPPGGWFWLPWSRPCVGTQIGIRQTMADASTISAASGGAAIDRGEPRPQLRVTDLGARWISAARRRAAHSSQSCLC